MNNSPLYRTSMQYGAYSGLSTFAFFLLIYFINSNPLGGKSMFGFWIPILFIFLGTKFHRDTDLGGYMNYWRGVVVGLFIALFASALGGLLVYLFGTLGDQGIIENFRAEQIAKIDESRQYVKSEFLNEMLDKAVEEINKSTIQKMAWGAFQNGIVYGAIISLIMAAILRKSKPFFEDPNAHTTIS